MVFIRKPVKYENPLVIKKERRIFMRWLILKRRNRKQLAGAADISKKIKGNV